MQVTQITNHVQQAIENLLQQYRGKKRIEDVLTVLVNQIQDLEDGIFPLDSGRQLANAVGDQLDGIGQIVGLERKGFDDETYRVFLIGAIAKNFSDGTIPVIRTILVLLYQAEFLLMFETFPAEIQIQFSNSTRDPSLYPLIADFVQQALGAGIRLGSGTVFDNTNPFRFEKLVGQDGPQGQGFGDASAPGTGGLWGNAIFTNSVS